MSAFSIRGDDQQCLSQEGAGGGGGARSHNTHRSSEARPSLDGKLKMAKFKAIMDSALNAIIATDDQGRLDMINSSACRIFGLDAEASLGSSLARLLVQPDGTSPPDDGMPQMLQEMSGTVREIEGRRADGSRFPMRVSISVVKAEGLDMFTAILRDVTKEKEQQAKTEQEQRKTKAIMDSALNAIITTDGEGRLDMINMSACRIFGLDAEASLGSSIASLLVQPDGTHFPEEDVVQLLTDMSGTVREMEGQRADGSRFPMRVSVSGVQTDGLNLFTAILRDVTKEKEQQAKTEKEQRKTKAIMDSAMNAIITTDGEGRLDMINMSACRIFGLDAEASLGSSIASLLVQPDGSHPVEADMHKTLADMSGTVHEMDGQRADGSRFPMRVSVSGVQTDGLNLFTAILRDITKEKVQKELLLAQQEEIRLERGKLAALLNTTVEGFIVTDSRGVIDSFNKSAERIFGYSASEVVGSNISIFMRSKHAESHGDYMRRHINGSSTLRGIVGHAREVTAVKKNGAEFRCLISISETTVNGEHLFTATVRDLSNEMLLMNILPAPIADRLKAKEMPISDGHDCVSILFADIVGFTAMSSSLSPHEVVSFLNDIFNEFDELADIYKLEKIKTIGDCYMVVSGIPEWSPDHAIRIACFALEMSNALTKYNKEKCPKHPLKMRIGIHCGPVIAGVIGKRKILYDIWGDAVNVASRMESTGIPNCVQVTDVFANKTAEWFDFENRGEIEVKGKGKMHTMFLSNVKIGAELQLVDKLSAANEAQKELSGQPILLRKGSRDGEQKLYGEYIGELLAIEIERRRKLEEHGLRASVVDAESFPSSLTSSVEALDTFGTSDSTDRDDIKDLGSQELSYLPRSISRMRITSQKIIKMKISANKMKLATPAEIPVMPPKKTASKKERKFSGLIPAVKAWGEPASPSVQAHPVSEVGFFGRLGNHFRRLIA